VENIDGEPIIGAEIYFGLIVTSAVYIETFPSIKSNERGQFIIPVLPQGFRYNLWKITSRGYGSLTIRVPAEDTETNHYSFPPIVLKRADQILAGLVVGADGKPIPGIKVELGGQGQPMGQTVSWIGPTRRPMPMETLYLTKSVRGTWRSTSMIGLIRPPAGRSCHSAACFKQATRMSLSS